MRNMRFSRRRALESLAGISHPAQQRPSNDPPRRLAPREELVNVLEFGDMARIKLPATVYSTIAGSNREPFDRMTFRTRRMINSMQLDLTTELLGEQMFAPILVGPVSQQQQFHRQGELATVEGASEAKTSVVVSSRSSYPIDQIAARAETPLWYQVYAEPDVEATREQAHRAVGAGCKAVCITVGTPFQPDSGGGHGVDWKVIDQIREGLGVPVLLKGIMTPEDAESAIRRGIEGLVVSDYGGRFGSRATTPIEVLPSISEAVGNRVPVLIDGSFRRGSDIVKALALGARAVLLGRPPMWGLAAYGAKGVQTMLTLLQTEVARSMAGAGRPNIEAIDRSLVRIHKR